MLSKKCWKLEQFFFSRACSCGWPNWRNQVKPLGLCSQDLAQCSSHFIPPYLFSAWYDLINSLLGLKSTPNCPLHLVIHMGRVGVLRREPKWNRLVVSSSCSQIRKPISFRVSIPRRSSPCKKNSDRFETVFVINLTGKAIELFSMRGGSCSQFLQRTLRTRHLHPQSPWYHCEGRGWPCQW